MSILGCAEGLAMTTYINNLCALCVFAVNVLFVEKAMK
jgi:hypothetical protein